MKISLLKAWLKSLIIHPFFQRIFKQVAGESPKQFITRMRLETAMTINIVRIKTVDEIRCIANVNYVE